MKKILFPLLLLIGAQNIQAQASDKTISFDGIGALQLGMSKAELEKLLKIKIVLKHIHVDEVYVETVKAKYMGVDVELDLMRSEDKVAILEEIGITNAGFKTADGVGIGTDQTTLINKYEKDLLIIQPAYEDGPEWKISKTRTTITHSKTESGYHAAIIYTLEKNKVIAIRVGPTPEFRDRE